MTAAPDALPDFDALPPGSRRVVALPVEPGGGHAPYTVPVHVLTGQSHRPRVVVTASIHGDEFEGVRACGLLLQALRPEELQGTLVVVPVAHPPAHAARTRRSPLDGGDLNRLFPGDAHDTPTERLASVLMEYVVAGADFLVDLHSGGSRYLFLPMVGYREQPPGGASLRAAVAFGLPWLWAIPDQPGVFTREAAARGVPTLGVEAGGSGGLAPGDVRLLFDGLLHTLRHLGMLPGESLEEKALAIYGGGWTLSPATGLLQSQVALGDTVTKRQFIAWISAPDGTQIAAMYAPHSGKVAAIRTFSAIDEGDWTAMILRRDKAAEARAWSATTGNGG